MGIVAAGVHHPRVTGCVRNLGLFPDRQSVHVGAKSKGLSGGIPVKQSDQTGTPNSFLNFYSEAFQVFGDAGGGAPLLKTELRVPVKVPTNLL
jgi:hypothetical protein